MEKRLCRENIAAQIWGSIIMSIVLSIAMPLIAGGMVKLYSFCSGFTLSFCASLVLKLFTPIIKVAGHLAVKLDGKPGTIPHRLISTMFLTLIIRDVNTPVSEDYLKNILIHNITEHHHLPRFLPELYGEYHNKPVDAD